MQQFLSHSCDMHSWALQWLLLLCYTAYVVLVLLILCWQFMHPTHNKRLLAMINGSEPWPGEGGQWMNAGIICMQWVIKYLALPWSFLAMGCLSLAAAILVSMLAAA
jgi:hypothetical protein